MIRSMTGYGRGEYNEKGRKFVVEMKSVNHRYNDMTIKMPRFLNSIEDKIRKYCMEKVFRGKTDIYITYESISADDREVVLDEALAEAYQKKLTILQDKFSLESSDLLGLLARFPDVLTVERQENGGDEFYGLLFPALEKALDCFIAMRETEGNALKEDILKKAEQITALTEKIKERAPFVVKEYKEKLDARLKELIAATPVDEQRLAFEVTVFADKSCIDEELTRLFSHIAQLRAILEEGGLVGRKLDFLVQEMNRETNTIASKANDLQITRATIELKSEIEKIREQVQNIE